MNKLCSLLTIIFLADLSGIAQSIQQGPYTIHTLAEHVYRIEDANDSNPPGVVTDDDGQMVGMNTCSDMYLVIGADKGLLIDLSNEIKWDDSATESLRSLVHERVGDKDLIITVTHRHGDHLGMLPAFSGDPEATFWIPGNEFRGMDIFPEERTTFFAENESLNLGGGTIMNTIEVPGHTEHSTIFFLEGKNLVFTGDAIGSGSGVWLFNEESFYTYIDAVDKLIAYIEDPANNIDTVTLRIYGGHYWLCSQPGEITARYIYDMRTLIGEMRKGTAQVEDMSAFISFLDANFKYGTATITWNKEAAAKFAQSPVKE
jgi:glyoxylase-like metal-dependent hydrolase (beta-lactamase superfamily II)